MSTTVNDGSEPGVGLRRPAGRRWPGPASEHAPEAAFDGGADQYWADQFLDMQTAIEELGRAIVATTRPDRPTGVASGNTDASGNLFLVVYAVAAGYQFRLTRAIGEAYGYTPPVPYAAAGAWLALYTTQQQQPPGGTFTGIENALQGDMLMFGPPVAGGPILPFVYTAEETEAPEVRGPRNLVLVVAGGPATTRITLRYQGELQRERGIA